jgi:hypothetical protein
MFYARGEAEDAKDFKYSYNREKLFARI